MALFHVFNKLPQLQKLLFDWKMRCLTEEGAFIFGAISGSLQVPTSQKFSDCD